MNSFCQFFKDKVTKTLNSYSKSENQELKTIIERIPYIFKIYTKMSNIQEQSFFQDSYLKSALQIVEQIIDNEEQSTSIIEINMSRNEKRTYLYKEEFKLIIDLILTLSEYDIK